uniref:Putative ribonuclease H-like domain-containing protein n=1 Tax=Tanacetum cinerariifolium TaxID=118510 RepID=A0A6L2MF04_TANCI|nr:putative ribonuclease H-like domain-containing protein [Tanacetum cinerariifolium]
MAGDDNNDYPIWKVIQNGNGHVSITTDTHGMIKVLHPKNAKEVMARERERKARTTLLMALLEDYLAKFHLIADAKEMWEAMKSRFGSNDESKKIQKFQTLLSQLDIHGAGVSNEHANQKFLRSLPSSWSQVALIMRTKLGLETLSFDDRYNNLRVFERNVKGTTASLTNTQNMALVSSENTSSTNNVSTAYSVSSPASQLDYNDLEQINDDDMEEMDLKCRTRDTMYNGNNARDNSRQPTYQEDSNVLVTVDGEDINWSRHVEEDAKNYAMMAYSSSNPASENKSVFINKESDLEDTPVNDRYTDGMHAVPPSMTGNYMPSGPDVDIDYSKFTYGPKQPLADEPDSKISEYASCDSDSSVETSTSMPEPVENASKVVCEPKGWTDAPISKEYESNSDDDLVSNVQEDKEKPSFPFTETVKHVNSFRENIKETDITNHNPKIEKQDSHGHTRKGLGYAFTQKACFVYGSFSHLIRDYDFYEKRMAKQAELTIKKNKDDPHKALKDKGIVDSRCSRNITGSKAHLAGYQEFKGGSVAFGGSNGRITSKGKIKTGSFNLKNIDPFRDLACLFAKASIEESNKWHRRLGHVNFKNLNKLVKGNLVRGLPSKIFENDNTCVACQKVKQHKASCKAKTRQLILLVFQMSSMGELAFFLGLQVKQKEDGIFISQDKYVAEILKKFDFLSVKTASTHIETQKPLIKDEEVADVDVTPKTSHLYAVKRIFRYLKGKPKLGLWYPKVSSFKLEAYSDSDYAGTNLDRKSTTRGCQFLSRRLISWQCKKQTIMATSTTEKKYVATAHCCRQVLWIQNQLLDYGFNLMNTKINIDNSNTICIVNNPVFHSKTKLIEIRYHFIRDAYEKKLIQAQQNYNDSPLLGVNTPRCDEDSLERKELMVIFVPICVEKDGIGAIVDMRSQQVLPCIMQFWSTAKVKSINDEVRIQALIDSKRVNIKESSIRRTLVLGDAEGISCLANAYIFYGLANIGYEKLSEKLTFYKAFFSPQWKFLIHTILQCLSAKTTSWNEFSSTMASTIICLATNQKFTFLRYILLSLVKNIEAGVPFYMFPRFVQLVIDHQQGVMSHHQDIYDNPSLSKKVFANMKRVGTGFSGVITPLFNNMIKKLEDRVDSLEEENRVLKKKSFKYSKVDTAAPVVEKEKSFKQEKIIADINEDDVDDEEPAEVEEVLEVVTAAKLMTEVVTTAEATTTAQAPKNDAVMRYQALKRKPFTEAQARKNMMIYLKNMAGFKMNYFKGMTYSEIKPLFEKHYNSNQAFLEKMDEEVTVQEKEVEEEGHKRQGRSLEKETTKKQKKDEEKEELKSHLHIVSNDDDDDVLEVKEESEMYLELLKLVRRQLNEGPASDAGFWEYCDKHYHQLLPIIAEKVHQEKMQREKLKEVKHVLASKDAQKETRRRKRCHNTPSPELQIKHHHERTCSPRTEMLFESEDSEGGHWKSKSQKQRSSIEDDDLSQPCVFEEIDPFTSRIRYFDLPKNTQVKMNDPNITMEEYIMLEEEKARRRGKVYNWETTTYGKIWYDEDIHDLRSVETEFLAIVFNV